MWQYILKIEIPISINRYQANVFKNQVRPQSIKRRFVGLV